jgi:membrane protein YdbS with pleckstrin-like domain
VRQALAPSERVLVDTPPHGRRLVRPLALAPVIVGVACFAAAALPASPYRTTGRWLLLAAAALLLAVVTVRPWLQWRARRVVVTTHRVVVRRGALRRRRRAVPIGDLSDVFIEQRFRDRLLRCGTLVLVTAGDGEIAVPDVPKVERVAGLLFGMLPRPPEDDPAPTPGKDQFPGRRPDTTHPAERPARAEKPVPW